MAFLMIDFLSISVWIWDTLWLQKRKLRSSV